MLISAFPNCCKARILSSFGGGHIQESDVMSDFYRNDVPRPHVATKEEVKDYLDSVIPQMKKEGITVIFACPTSHQPSVIEALQEYGFYGAEQEDLESAGCEYVINEYGKTSYGVPAPIKKSINIKHYMVPMFYLIPKTGNRVVQWN